MSRNFTTIPGRLKKIRTNHGVEGWPLDGLGFGQNDRIQTLAFANLTVAFRFRFAADVGGGGGGLRVRRSSRAGRAARAHSETVEPAERRRVVQLRLRERGRHVQNRNQVPDRRGVRQVRLRGRDGQTPDGRVRRFVQGIRTGGRWDHGAATRAGRRLQRPASGPADVPRRLRRRAVPRGSRRILQVGAATGAGRQTATTAVVQWRPTKATDPVRFQAVAGPSGRARFRSVVRVVFGLVLGTMSVREYWRATGPVKVDITKLPGAKLLFLLRTSFFFYYSLYKYFHK